MRQGWQCWVFIGALIGGAHAQEVHPGSIYVRTIGFLDAGVIPWSSSRHHLPEHKVGVELVRERRYGDAAALFYKSTRSEPENLLSHLGYVTANVARGKESVAAMADAYLLRIRAERDASRSWKLAQTLALAASLVELARMTPEVGRASITLVAQAPYHDEIQTALSTATPLAHDNRDASLWLSNIQNRLGREDLRRSVLQKYLASHPRDIHVRHQLAKCYQGGTAGTISFPPNFDPAVRARMEREANASRVRMDLSLSESLRIIEENPKFGPAYYLAGSSSYHLKKLGDARLFFTAYLKLEPTGLRAEDAKRYLAQMGSESEH